MIDYDVIPEGTGLISGDAYTPGPAVPTGPAPAPSRHRPPAVPVVPAPKNHVGRRYAFTEAKQEAYLEEIRHGAGRELAAHNVKVDPKTVRAYRVRCPEFEAEIIAAESVRNQKVVNALFENAMNGNATAQIFWVTNRMPDDWQDKRGPRVLQQINAGPSVEWSLQEARAEALGIIDEIDAKRRQKEAQAADAIEAESREVDDGNR